MTIGDGLPGEGPRRAATAPFVPDAWRRVSRGVASGDVLNRDRLLGYGVAVCLGYALLVAILVLGKQWPVGADGVPVHSDFVNVWAAGSMAAAGDAAAIYDFAAHKRAQVEAIGAPLDVYYPWRYPPTFLLAAAPLSFLPYVPAWMVWNAVGLAVLLAALRLVLPGRAAAVGAVAAPTTLCCALLGQNGLLTAGLMAGALALLDRRPWLAGALLGLLTYKPQYGVLFPLALLLTRRWEAVAAAALAALALAGASALVFGAEVWAAFLATVSAADDLLRPGALDWFKLQSIYAWARQASGSGGVAWAVHLSASAALAAGVAAVWLRGAAPAVRSAALLAAAYLVTPYAFLYDAPILTAAAAFLLKDGLERGFRAYDKALLCLGYLLPGLIFVNLVNNLVAPAAALVLFALAVRRAVPPTAASELAPPREARA